MPNLHSALKPSSNHLNQFGSGLIEILVVIFLLSSGMLAMTKMHSILIRDSGTANNRSLATSLLQEKFDDLKSFKWTHPAADTEGCGDGISCFSEIGNDTGGQEFPGTSTLRYPSGAITAGFANANTVFNRNWTVTDYYDCAGTFSTNNCAGTAAKDFPDLKLVTVAITWTDTNGPGSLKISGAIFSTDNSIATLPTSGGTGGGGPVVTYTPSNSANVVPISVGSQSKRETIVPSSILVDGLVQTSFTAYTYSNTGVLSRKEDFKTVACECRFNGTSTDDDQTRRASYPKWDPDQNTFIDVVGDLVTGKSKGCVQGGGSTCDANPDAYCDLCCRDHHDDSATPRKFDPYRSNDDFSAGNHKHYNGTSTAVTSGTYLESCRLKRINGYWRVYQDWHQIDLKNIPLTDFSNSTNKSDYASYVENLVGTYIQDQVNSSQLPSSSLPTFPSALKHDTTLTAIPIAVGERVQLSARGIYLDFMDSDHISALYSLKNGTPPQDYLLHTPFYEIDVTSPSAWISASPTDKVRVGPYNGPGSSNDLISGQLQGLATHTSAIQISAEMRKSNSGLAALSYPIDFGAATHPDTAKNTDSLLVCPGCSSTSCSLPWGATLANGSSIDTYLSASVVSPAICTLRNVTCNSGVFSAAPYDYASCTVQPATSCITPWETTVNDGANVTAYQASTAPTCVSETRTCGSGTLSGSYQYESCTATPPTCTTTVSGKVQNQSLNWTVSVFSGTTTVSCTTPAANGNFTCNPITTATNAEITVRKSASGQSDVDSILETNCGSQPVSNL